MSEPRIDIKAIEDRIEGALADWGVPGASAVVCVGGEPVSARGYGETVLGDGRPVGAGTGFAIGSLTKAFVAMLTGILVEEGRLGWDDPVKRWVPGFRLGDDWISERVTIRDLLCHRTGIKRAIRLLWKDEAFDPEDFIRRGRYMGFDRGFREGFGYANLHYVAVGLALEAASGMPWERLLSERLLGPLGMASSFATYGEALRAGVSIAGAHASRGDGLVPGALRCLDPVEPIPFEDLGCNAAGSMVSTATDMGAWLSALLGKAGRRAVLPAAAMGECLSLQVPIRQERSDLRFIADMGAKTALMGYGLGWYLTGYRGEALAFHDGQTRGSCAAIAFCPSTGVGAAILTNVYHTAVHQALGFELLDAVAGIRSDYCGPAKALMGAYRASAEQGAAGALAARARASGSPEDYEGAYESEAFGEVSIAIADDGLEYRYGRRASGVAALEPWGGETYRVRYRCGYLDDEFLTFERGEAGRATGFELKGAGRFRRLS